MLPGKLRRTQGTFYAGTIFTTQELYLSLNHGSKHSQLLHRLRLHSLTVVISIGKIFRLLLAPYLRSVLLVFYPILLIFLRDYNTKCLHSDTTLARKAVVITRWRYGPRQALFPFLKKFYFEYRYDNVILGLLLVAEDSTLLVYQNFAKYKLFYKGLHLTSAI